MSPPSVKRRAELKAASRACQQDQAAFKPLIPTIDINDIGIGDSPPPPPQSHPGGDDADDDSLLGDMQWLPRGPGLHHTVAMNRGTVIS